MPVYSLKCAGGGAANKKFHTLKKKVVRVFNCEILEGWVDASVFLWAWLGLSIPWMDLCVAEHHLGTAKCQVSVKKFQVEVLVHFTLSLDILKKMLLPYWQWL